MSSVSVARDSPKRFLEFKILKYILGLYLSANICIKIAMALLCSAPIS